MLAASFTDGSVELFLPKNASPSICSVTRGTKSNIQYTDFNNSQTQGAIVGPNQAWPQAVRPPLNVPDFSGQRGQPDTLPYREVFKFSVTNAIVYFAASTVGAFLCDPLTHVFVGRRGAIFVAALFTFTASIGEGLVQSWQALFACRLWV